MPCAADAAQEGAAQSSQPRHDAADAPERFGVDHQAQRLRAGRTRQVFLQLAEPVLWKPLSPTSSNTLKPQRGLSCKIGTRRALIIDVFTRRGQPKLDVGLLDWAGGNLWKLDCVKTVAAAEASDVGFHMKMQAPLHGKCVLLEEVESPCVSDLQCCVKEINALRSFVESVSQARPEGPWRISLQTELESIRPATAKQHCEANPGHTTVPRADKANFVFLLDLPLPVPLDVRPHRCSQCKHPSTNIPDSEIGNYFPVTPQDIAAAVPHGRWMTFGKDGGPYVVTPAFMINLLQLLYEHFNVRQVRRTLVHQYASNLLQGFLRQSLPAQPVLDTSPLAWSMSAVPRIDGLQRLILAVFRQFVKDRVQAMVDLQLLFNGQGLRVDGNFDMARQVTVYENGVYTRPYHVLLAWCGVDGSLLKPITLARSEKVIDITSDVEPMIDRMLHVRMNAGFSLEQCVPVFHATDSYRTQRKKLMRFYKRKFDQTRLATEYPTPRGDAQGKHIREGTVPALLKIVGDPPHDTWNARSAASPWACDYHEFCADHADMLARLSAPAAPSSAQHGMPRMDLPPAGLALLKTGVHQHAEAFGLAVKAHETAATQLKLFIAQPHALHSPMWMEVFGAHPPRGVLARFARRLEVELDESCGFYAYRSRAEFEQEIDKMEAWYKPGRKTTRRARLKLREGDDEGKGGKRAKGLTTVWTRRVRTHYARLRQELRLQGLWAWKGIADALHRASIPLQTGTMPVERAWAVFKTMLPAGARRISHSWFNFLSELAFLRTIYTHFHQKDLSTWARGDALLAQELETLLDIAKAWRGDAHMSGLLEEVEGRMSKASQECMNAPAPEPTGSQGAHVQGKPSRDETAAFMRILLPTWSDALAAGLKSIETVRYKRHSTNSMKFAARGTLLAFGTSAKCQGVAILAGPATTGHAVSELESVLTHVDPQYHGELRSYLQEGVVFDLVHVSTVYDLRELDMSWRDIVQSCGVHMPPIRQGFPCVGGPSVRAALLKLGSERGVRREF